jgi:SNF2 family DNA or RNA helicase
MGKPEQQIEGRLGDAAKEHGWLYVKLGSPSLNGMPDRLLVIPDKGHHIFIELKREKGGRLSEQQKLRIRQLQKGGADVRVIHLKEQVDDLVREFDPSYQATRARKPDTTKRTPKRRPAKPAAPAVREPQEVHLHDYQVQMKEFIKHTPYCALWLDMGMGKSLTTLAALSEIPDTGNVLVVAVKHVIRSVWADEIEKWGFPMRHRSLRFGPRGGELTQQKRHERYLEPLTEQPTVYFANKDILADMVAFYQEHVDENTAKLKAMWPNADERLLRALCTWPYPTVVIDEAHNFRNNTTAHFKALAQVRPYIRRLVELTGTPMPKDYLDLWSQLYLLDTGARLGPTLDAYTKTFFDPGRTVKIGGNLYRYDKVIEWKPKPGATDAIKGRISDICKSMANDKLKLPPLNEIDTKVYLDAAERTLYETLKEKLVVKVDEGIVDAQNALGKLNKLSQLASGIVYLTNEDPDDTRPNELRPRYDVIHRKKLDMCSYIVENTNSPVLVCYYYQSEREEIEKHFRNKGFVTETFDGSPEMCARWNNDEIRVLLLQASKGEGANLQSGSGHTIVWFTLPLRLDFYEQAYHRIWRQGQKQPVFMHRLVCDNTVDEIVLAKLKKKKATQADVIEAVRLCLEQ